MDKEVKEIEIPFGAKDSELCGWEYTIPEGMEDKAPDKIYLQVCGDCSDNDCKNCKFEEDNVTWCKERIFPKDIEYTRTDACADTFIEKDCAWIKSKEKMPKHCELVFCACLDVQRESFQYYVGWYNANKKEWFLTDFGCTSDVAFWMPIPKLDISDL